MKNLFWDSCILIRYFLNDEAAPYFHHICKYIKEAKDRNPRWRIHISTLSLAEIRPSCFKGDHRNLEEFFEDFGSAFSPIDPNPNILRQAAKLKDSPITNPSPKEANVRSVATPDAILLTTCLYAKNFLDMKDILFHSTDEGKGKGWAGKSVPIIGFERWYPESTRTEVVSQVCALKRELPIHPEPDLFSIPSNPVRGIIQMSEQEGSRPDSGRA